MPNIFGIQNSNLFESRRKFCETLVQKKFIDVPKTTFFKHKRKSNSGARTAGPKIPDTRFSFEFWIPKMLGSRETTVVKHRRIINFKLVYAGIFPFWSFWRTFFQTDSFWMGCSWFMILNMIRFSESKGFRTYTIKWLNTVCIRFEPETCIGFFVPSK